MKHVSVYLLILFAILGMLGAESSATAPEPQLPAQPPLAGIPQATKAPLHTPEQEAALTEVRKILREAREVAEAIQIPAPLLSDRHRRKALERAKTNLINGIERAQLQAGDVTIPFKYKETLALAQARYGLTNEAVQTASTDETLRGDGLLSVVEALVQSGDIPAAIRLAEIQLPRDGVELFRQKTAALVYAYIAEEQHKAGDLNAHDTLNRAVKEVPRAKFAHTQEYIQGLIALGRAQAALGDKVASADTFQRAIAASLVKYPDRDLSGLLMPIAKVQAESGDRTGSEQTFQRAIGRRTAPRDLTCLAWAQAVTGQRDAALRSFTMAIDDAEKLPVKEKILALRDIMPWQLKIDDWEGARSTVNILRQAGFESVSILGDLGEWRLAHALAISRPTAYEKANALAYVSRTLVKTKHPFGTPELLKQLSETASALSAHTPPMERSQADHMFKTIAVVQAAAGDLQAAQATIEKISSILRSGAYSEVIHVQIEKGDLLTAGKMLTELREDWRPFTDSFRKLGKAYAQLDQKEPGLAFLRQQHNAYEKASGLLGVGEGFMKQHEIERVWRSELLRRNGCPDIFKYE